MRNKKFLLVGMTLVFSMLGSTFLHAATDDITDDTIMPISADQDNEVQDNETAENEIVENADVPVLTNYLKIDLNKEEIYENEGNIMVPLRKLAEAFEHTVEWDAETSTAYVVAGEVKYPVKEGVVSYEEHTLTFAPELKEDRLFVPVTFAETLGISYVVSDDVISFSRLYTATQESEEPVDETEATTETEEEPVDETTEEAVQEEEKASDEPVVKGEVIEIKSSTLKMRAESGFILTFDIGSADTSEAIDINPGDWIEIYYTGEIHNEFTNNATVTRVVTID